MSSAVLPGQGFCENWHWKKSSQAQGLYIAASAPKNVFVVSWSELVPLTNVSKNKLTMKSILKYSFNNQASILRFSSVMLDVVVHYWMHLPSVVCLHATSFQLPCGINISGIILCDHQVNLCPPMLIGWWLSLRRTSLILCPCLWTEDVGLHWWTFCQRPSLPEDHCTG